MAKREISAKAFVKDFRSGMDEADILGKYSLSRERLRLILKKLIDAKALGQEEVDSWLSASEAKSQPEHEAESSEGLPIYSDSPRRLRIPRKPPEPPPTAQETEETTPPGASSEAVGYRLKLYGRTSNDPEVFSANLAAVLGIDAATARDYLNRVPVTVKEGLSQQKAERLRSVLASVGALCLVEPMDGAEEQPSPPVPARETSIADALLMRPTKTDEDSSLLPSRVQPSMIALFGVILFLCVGGLYLLLATRSAREDISLHGPIQKSATQEVQSAQTFSDEEALPALKVQISYLEDELPKLQARLTEEQAGFDLLVNTPGTTYDELQKKNSAIQEIQDQISNTRWQIRTLKKRVTLLERSTTAAQEMESASQSE